MRFAISLPCLAILSLPGCGAPAEHPEIRAVLTQQQHAWNAGDLDGFMAHYWRSDELVFTSPKGEFHGWQAVMDRYQRAYPTQEQMGQLRFEQLQIARTGEDRAEISGRYRLKLRSENKTGRFYLTLRCIDDRWVIVRDQTFGD